MYLDRNKCAGTLFPFNAGAFHFFVVAVLANVGLVRAIFCKYGSKNGPNLRFCCRTCGKCGSQSLCVQVRHKTRWLRIVSHISQKVRGTKRTVPFVPLLLEFCEVHVALLGECLVQGKGFVESVAGLTFLGNLEVIPHELLVVRMHAVLDDALGALGR